MQQMARNATGETWDSWSSGGTHLHDRDNKFCSVFRGDARGWWYKTDSTPGAQSKPECVPREMGAIGEKTNVYRN